jgi:hypothetical protein
MEQARLSLKPVEKIFNSTVKKTLNGDFSRFLVNALVILALIYNAERFPLALRQVLEHSLAQYLLLFTSVFLSTQDFALAFVVTVLAVLVVMFMRRMNEVEDFRVLEVVPGCEKATVADLLALFGGDSVKLSRAMYTIGIPLNTELTEESAPLVASYFVNYGKKVSGTCQGPTN